MVRDGFSCSITVHNSNFNSIVIWYLALAYDFSMGLSPLRNCDRPVWKLA